MMEFLRGWHWRGAFARKHPPESSSKSSLARLWVGLG